jgi:chromosomal replication initiation ATPase DnaA
VRRPFAGDERILGSSHFVEKTLEQTGEDYGRRMRTQASGLDQSLVIEAVCGFFKVEEIELASPTRRPEIARTRALVGFVATRDLSITGSEVAVD